MKFLRNDSYNSEGQIFMWFLDMKFVRKFSRVELQQFSGIFLGWKFNENCGVQIHHKSRIFSSEENSGWNFAEEIPEKL